MISIEVPCKGCVSCCQHEAVVLQPAKGDVVEDYLHWVLDGPVVEAAAMSLGINATKLPVLQRKPNGDCVYLGPKGCTIHERAPVMCRSFDCRIFYLKWKRSGGQRIDKVHQPIIDAGHRRVDTLSLQTRLNVKKGGNGCSL
jgi:Fe-S-cluster containining protein